MKRILSVFLAAVLALGMMGTAAFAADAAKVVSTGTLPTSLSVAAMDVGGTFTIIFPANNFADVADGFPNSYPANAKDWLKITDAAAGDLVAAGNFTVNSVTVDAAAANAAVFTVTANKAKSYTAADLFFNLNDGTNPATTPVGLALTVNNKITSTPTSFALVSPASFPETIPAGGAIQLQANLTWADSALTNIPSLAALGLEAANFAPHSGFSVVPSINASGNLIVTLTAVNAGSGADINIASATQLLGATFATNAYLAPNAFAIQTAGANSIIAPYPTGFTLTSPASLASLVGGDQVKLSVSKSSFNWASATKPKDFTVLNTGSFIPNANFTVSNVDATTGVNYDGSHVIVTLTAKDPAAAVTIPANTELVKYAGAASGYNAPNAFTISPVNVITKPDVMNKGLATNYFVNTKAALSNPDSLTVHAGDVIYLPFSGDMFGGNTKSTMTEANLKSKKLTLRISSGSNSKLIDSYKITTDTFNLGSGSVKTAAVKIEFVDPFRSIKDLDFDITICPVFDGSRRDDLSITLSGTMAVETVEVDSSDDYVELDGRYVADATEYIKLIEADLGEGVSVWGKMYSGKQYWGSATTEPTSTDEAIFDKYPSIDLVYNLDTIGLSSTASYVLIDGYGSDYYVYDANMKYLGKSNQKLPYSSKYYFSTKKLTEEEVEEVDDDDDTGEPISEDALNPGTNKNDNPGTGR